MAAKDFFNTDTVSPPTDSCDFCYDFYLRATLICFPFSQFVLQYPVTISSFRLKYFHSSDCYLTITFCLQALYIFDLILIVCSIWLQLYLFFNIAQWFYGLLLHILFPEKRGFISSSVEDESSWFGCDCWFFTFLSLLYMYNLLKWSLWNFTCKTN